MKRIRGLRSRPIGTVSIEHDASIAEAVLTFREHDVSGLVVYEGGALAGIFTKNDLVRCCCDHPNGHQGCTVADYMTRDIFTAPADADLETVAERMIDGDFRHVPVTENGRVVGMVTPIDILIHQKSALATEREDLVRYIRGMY